ncbi:pitrilysin family protein [Mechercharimyces sp. CAU 1602]|uniref:M16 family metallopeptidase n=1 Tax=Mechercharimyces sp. CAU 1602 TaxID=2973933 RepID=UPI0021625D56|nr:insulinase family protein [Mechercharimyces sp. CAU 1602]MCS1352502.1 insulinase family protein [Mechercharimyces sp. CAU 1602]
MVKPAFTSHPAIESFRTAMGMEVLVVPLTGCMRTYATLAIGMGAMEQYVSRKGDGRLRLPFGTAHFLEHLVYHQFLSNIGMEGDTHAVTSHWLTCYQVATTREWQQAIVPLLAIAEEEQLTVTEFIMRRERRVISHEIEMYQEQGNVVVDQLLKRALFPSGHPLTVDIAGTTRSVADVSAPLLQQCFDIFYRAERMKLVLVGNVTSDEVHARLGDFESIPAEDSRREEVIPTEKRWEFYSSGKGGVVVESRPVPLPFLKVGFMEQGVPLAGELLLRYLSIAEVALEALWGKESEFYQSLFEQGVIGDHFNWESKAIRGCAYSSLGGVTANPQMVVDQIKERLVEVSHLGLAEERIERAKERRAGKHLLAADDLRHYSITLAHGMMQQMMEWKRLAILKSVTISDVEAWIQSHCKIEGLRVAVVEKG